MLASSPARPTAPRQSQGFDWFDGRGFTTLGWTVASAYLLLQVLAGFARPLSAFDDCIPLISADLIHHGRKPITDFYYLYPPFLDYLYALGFRAIGRTLMAPRIFSSILYIAIAILAPGLLTKRAPSLRPLRPMMMLMAAVSLVGVSRLPVWPAYGFSLLAILSYPGGEDADAPATRRRLFLCGLLAGISMLMRLNFGLYAAAVLCVYAWLRIRTSEVPKSFKRFRTFTPFALLILGAALPSILFYGSVYGSGALSVLGAIVRSTQAALPARFIVLQPTETCKLLLFPFFWWVLPVIVQTNRIGTDPLIAGIMGTGLLFIAMAARGNLFVPLIVSALTLSIFVILSLRPERLRSDHLIFALFYAAILHYYLSRADAPHAAPVYALQGLMFIPLLIPANFGATDAPDATRERGAALAILVAGICIYGNSSEAIPVREVVARGARLTINWIRTPKIADSERIQGQLTGDWQSIFSPAEGGFEGELNAIKYIASHTRVSDPIFVGARDNSMIYVNDIRVYWLTGRLPGARYFELDAGVASIAPVQDGIIRDLEKGGVNWAILQDEKGEGDLSFLARAHPESRRLDDFFITRFFEVERFGQFSVVKRR